jgi:hypothetical protein
MKSMFPNLNVLVARAARSVFLGAALLCLGAAILHADEGRAVASPEPGHLHCRIYFGCLPDLAKERGHASRF